MFKLGEYQVLKISKQVEFGVYLTDGADKEERVLLPGKQVPEGAGIGDEIKVFIYRDSEDRLIATTAQPLLTMGNVARLRVVSVAKVGAFLDWGLEKDLFLPFKEQTFRVAEKDEVLVALYIDKSSRLCATMNVYESLRNDSTYRKDDKVEGTVYQISENFGVFVAVDDIYSALVPKKALFGAADKIKTGAKLSARVSRVMPDGRLELAVRDKSYIQQREDAEMILDMLGKANGRLPFNDKASPELIAEKTGMSKAQFKRAVGKLLKEGHININPDSIELRKD
ncbi:MAG: RNA-binding protein [Lachnospiraceae bacterium]|nr:RNA-binding protein [Lachnospiraceae bacterium]